MMNILQRNNVRVSGNGSQAIVFAHGYGCDQAMWRMVSPAFEQDYKVVLFDYVGAGRSDLDAYDPERYSSLSGYAKDVVDVCEALDLQNVILVGHSVSSMICLLATNTIPDRIERVIMICPSPRYLNDARRFGIDVLCRGGQPDRKIRIRFVQQRCAGVEIMCVINSILNIGTGCSDRVDKARILVVRTRCAKRHRIAERNICRAFRQQQAADTKSAAVEFAQGGGIDDGGAALQRCGPGEAIRHGAGQ